MGTRKTDDDIRREDARLEIAETLLELRCVYLLSDLEFIGMLADEIMLASVRELKRQEKGEAT